MADSTQMRRTFLSIMIKGRKANTYKFALARYLLEYSNQAINPNEPVQKEILEIPYAKIAGKFLEYYWHQECRFKIRQSFNKEKPAYAIQAIRNEFGRKYYPESFKDISRQPKYKKKIQNAEEDILNKVLGKGTYSNVIPRFQNISEGSRTKSNQIFYKHDDDERILYLKPEAFQFFRDNNSFLTRSVILEWAKLLEKINTLPRLIAKIESGEEKRGSVRKYVKIFHDVDSCFYCGTRLEKGYIDVDHFIPWSYMYEDEAWNLVLSCRRCNNKKRDSLADESYLKDLIERNCKLYNKLPIVRRSLDDLDVGNGWEHQLEHNYNNCKEHGFSVAESI